jgi:peptide/nickel transport system permease protein
MTDQPVLGLIVYNLPYTIELTIVAMIMGVVVGVPFGVWAATHRNGLPDSAMRGFSLFGYAIPDFYLGALLLITFALNLGWFPINGGGTGFIDRMHHVFLPALTLALVKAAFIGRLTRTSLLEVMGRDYVRTARAKGARETRVIYRHGLRNALLPLTTGLGLSMLATLSGSVAIELVFNRPGIGKLLISAISERDYGVIQGGVVVFAMFVVLINLAMDLVYIVVDPRIRVK